MSWDAVGAISEAFGAIGVVLTLIYLASQLRQNTAALKANSFDSFTQLGNNKQQFHANHADVIAKARSHAELTRSEQIIADSSNVMLLNLIENIYHHHRSGIMDDATFDDRIEGFRKNAQANIALSEFWERQRLSLLYTKDFIRFMDELIGIEKHIT